MILIYVTICITVY